ncbi:MAG: hypothetical protein E7231_08155 [Cellulosilyticum sp.]|nr:hypothetical protein [Cellulosilyticum sp.]
MSSLNKPIEMISCCNPLGEMMPIKFRMEGDTHQMMVASIQEVLYKKESHIAGMQTFEYGCKISIEDRVQLVEVSYQVNSHRWLIKKIIG